MNDGVRMPPSKTVRFAPRKGNADAPVPACVNASVTHHIDGVEWTPSRHLGPVVAQKPEDEGPFSRLERAHDLRGEGAESHINAEHPAT